MGTVAVVGISTKEASLQCNGYVGLLGSDQQSWGWNLVDNHLLHNGDTLGHYPKLNNCPKYQVSVILLHLYHLCMTILITLQNVTSKLENTMSYQHLLKQYLEKLRADSKSNMKILKYLFQGEPNKTNHIFSVSIHSPDFPLGLSL